MNDSCRILIWVLAVFSLTAASSCTKRSQRAERERLVDAFVTCMGDSFSDVHRREARNLFESFWKRADAGNVIAEDADTVIVKLRRYAKARRISTDDLLYFLAQVGYFTYRKDPRYNLPGGVPDHPTINPDAGILTFERDSLTGKLIPSYGKLEPEHDSSPSPEP